MGGQGVILVMEGVFHESVVLVDDVPVAVHGDGWTPIEVDLTGALDGKTAFVLGVDARVPDDRHGGRFSQSLAAKQDWYGVQGGIWKPARIEARNPIHIARSSPSGRRSTSRRARSSPGAGCRAGAGEASA